MNADHYGAAVIAAIIAAIYVWHRTQQNATGIAAAMDAHPAGKHPDAEWDQWVTDALTNLDPTPMYDQLVSEKVGRNAVETLALYEARRALDDDNLADVMRRWTA